MRSSPLPKERRHSLGPKQDGQDSIGNEDNINDDTDLNDDNVDDDNNWGTLSGVLCLVRSKLSMGIFSMVKQGL